MKKIFVVLMISVFTMNVVGCQNRNMAKVPEGSKNYTSSYKEPSVEKSADTNKNTGVCVKIKACSDSKDVDGMPIIMNPELIGSHEGDIQYHWILKNDSDFEGFAIPGKGPQKEIINAGETVELGLFAKVEWVKDTLVKFSVELRVEEKGTSKVIARDEIYIDNHCGVYSISNN